MKKTMKIFLAIMAIVAILNINVNKEYEDGSLEEMPIYELIEHNSKVKYKKFKMEYNENKRIKNISKKVRKWENENRRKSDNIYFGETITEEEFYSK